MSGRVGRILVLGAALVLWAAPAGPARASNDPAFGRQWGLAQVGAPNAWARSTGAGVKVGIVDSGVDLAHEDLVGAVVASTACLDGQCRGSAQDDDGHGTHVAGIIGARKDNGRGVAGVAPSSQLVVAKVFQQTNQGYVAYDDDVIAGIKWVVDQGARVVNLSLGDFVPIVGGLFGGDTSLKEGIDYAWSKGAVAVLAAGNTNVAGFGSANYGELNALVVGATGRSGRVATSYSSPLGNAKWGLVAPGGDGTCDSADASVDGCVFSTYWESGRSNLYNSLKGTSMAAPHVAGALADVFAANPGFTAQQAVDRVLATLARIECGSGCKGRLDVANAVGAGVTPPPAGGGGGGAGGGGASGGGTGGGGASTPPRRSPTTRGSGGTRAPAIAGATVPPGDATTTTSVPAAADYSLGSDELDSPDAARVRIRPDEDSDSSLPAGVGVLGALGVLGAGGATAFVIRARGGASAVLEALRPGAGP